MVSVWFVKKYASANHSKIDDYNKSEESKHIIYLDANNLYGFSMSEYLPTGFEQFELQCQNEKK